MIQRIDLYFQTLYLTKTKTFLNLGSKTFCNSVYYHLYEFKKELYVNYMTLLKVNIILKV